MGQAKQRANKNKQWIDSLSAGERIIADTADKLLNRLLRPMGATGMCYRMTFFQHLYLAEKGIQTVPLVGYVNDGTDNLMISHAWLVYNGKKTDITLAATANPEINPAGQVIVLDRVLRSGHHYTYHLEQSPEGLAAETEMLRDTTGVAIVNQKRAEHVAMLARAKDPSAVRTFLDSAPDKFTFEKIKAVIDSRITIKPT